MSLDIDGAGRSRSLACLPTARGPGKVRTSAGNGAVDPGGVWAVQGPLCERILGPDTKQNRSRRCECQFWKALRSWTPGGSWKPWKPLAPRAFEGASTSLQRPTLLQGHTSLISTRRLLGLFQPLRTFSVHK